MGEFIGIRFGRVDPVSNTVDWKYLPHSQYDGIGGFAHLLREAGAEVGELPKITHPGAMSWWPFVRFIPTLLKPRRYLRWKALKQGPKLADTNQPAPAVAWHVFNEEETAKIRRASRAAEVTVNSFLLKYLDRSIRPSLEDPSSAIPWMVPVNLRGRVTQPRDTENHSSYVGIRIYASEGMKEVQDHIYQALARGEHIATWKTFAASKHTSPAMKRQIIKANRATSQWSVGGLSNLGVWDPDGEITQEGCRGAWLFAPPVLRFQMIGAGCVTFQGKLGLTLQVHPELTTAPEVPAEWMKNWIREIELSFPEGQG